MILRNIKLSFLKRKLKKAALVRTRQRKNAKLKTIGIIVDIDHFEAYEEVMSLSENLALKPKNISVLCFTENHKNYLNFETPLFTLKDFSWNGILKKQELKDFVNKEFDVVIGYFNNSNPCLDYMTAILKAPFKIGLQGSLTDLFDLIINVDINDTEVFKNEAVKYLKILKKI